MSPRPYRSKLREAAAGDTRARILDAARSLLSVDGPLTFTIDAISAQADVARMTVYYQFGSKRGLIEAISDDLARRGGIGRLPEAFTTPEPLAGLDILVEVFTGLWDSERQVVRRLRALSSLDPEFGDHEDRNQRRRQAITVLLRRLTPPPPDLDDKADLVLALTSFDTFETLTASGRDAGATARLVTAAVRQLLS